MERKHQSETLIDHPQTRWPPARQRQASAVRVRTAFSCRYAIYGGGSGCGGRGCEPQGTRGAATGPSDRRAGTCSPAVPQATRMRHGALGTGLSGGTVASKTIGGVPTTHRIRTLRPALGSRDLCHDRLRVIVDAAFRIGGPPVGAPTNGSAGRARDGAAFVHFVRGATGRRPRRPGGSLPCFPLAPVACAQPMGCQRASRGVR